MSEGRPTADVLNASIFGIWAGGEKMLPLFDYLAATKKSRHPIMLTGFDIQFSGSDLKRTVSEFPDRLLAGLAGIDKDPAKEETQLHIAQLVHVLAEGSFDKLTNNERDSAQN